jgi:hypothetical protein
VGAEPVGRHPRGGSPFPDIAGSVHATDIREAAAAGLTSGTANGTDDPAGRVSRQQMATFVSQLLAATADARVRVTGTVAGAGSGSRRPPTRGCG